MRCIVYYEQVIVTLSPKGKMKIWGLLLQLWFWQLWDCRWLEAQYMTDTKSYSEEQGERNTVYFIYDLTFHNQIC